MIRYELMTASHVEAVAHLEQVCFSDPWSLASVTSELTNPLSLWVVALDGDKVVGYVGSQTVMGDADMMNIAVDPDYRKRGIALLLVETLICRLREKDAVSLTLEVRASNVPAISLYEKLGFQQVGVRPNYYRNPKENAILYRKEWAL